MVMKSWRHLFAGMVCALSIAATPATQPTTGGGIFNVMDFGAVADGKTPSTIAIQKAIDACGAAGGGRVLIPAGTYLSFPLELRSGVDLHVDAGAIVNFSREHQDYPLIISSYEGRETAICQAPISGNNLHDVSITGDGIFDGQGDSWRMVKRSKLSDAQWDALVKSGGVVDEKKTTWWPSQADRTGFPALAALRKQPGPPNLHDYQPYRDLLRPNLILLTNSHHLLLQGPTFRNSGSWNIHLLDSDDITIRGITVFNPLSAQNGDGIDIDSCKNVLIEKSTIHAGDDDICLKSGRDEEGREHNRPTENVTVRDCTIGWGHGISIGSEMSGGVRNVDISNCTMDGTDFGLRFKTTRGRGGVVENIHINHITMAHIVKDAILFDMYYMQKNPQPEPVSERTPIFRNITITDVTCDGAKKALDIRGLSELPMSQLRLQNISLTADTGASISDVQDITLKNVTIQSSVAPAIEYQNAADLHVENLQAIVVSISQPKESSK
jgi:polygalacturonase